MNRLKLAGLAAAAIAVFGGAPTANLPTFNRPGNGIATGLGGRRRRRGYGWKNNTAREHGIPKAFRQYAKRYGSSVTAMVKMHQLLNHVRTLDHWRDRREAFQRAVASLQRAHS